MLTPEKRLQCARIINHVCIHPANLWPSHLQEVLRQADQEGIAGDFRGFMLEQDIPRSTLLKLLGIDAAQGNMESARAIEKRLAETRGAQ